MRILHAVHDFLPRHRAGSEVHVADLCHALEDRGHAAHVLCAEYDPRRRHGTVDWRWHEGLGVTEVVNNWEFSDLTEATSPPRLRGVLAHLLNALEPEVLHLHSVFNLSFELPRLAAERGIPVVATLHDFTAVCPSGGKRVHRAEQHLCLDIDPERCARCFAQSPQRRQMAAAKLARPGVAGGLVLQAARLARRRAPALLDRLGRLAAAGGGDAVADRAAIEWRLRSFFDDVVPHVTRFVAPSAALAADFVRLGLPSSQVEVAGNGIEPFEPATVERPRRPLRIGYVGSLTWEKGVHLLVAAAERLEPSSFELHLFGEAPEGDYESLVRGAARRLPIHFHGGFDRARVAAVYAAIDVLVVPSIWLENSPLVIHEAHLAGVPVVGSRLGGIAELVRDGENGLLFDPFAPGELSGALAGLIADPGRVAAFSRRLPSVKTVEESAGEWEGRYRQVVAVVRRTEGDSDSDLCPSDSALWPSESALCPHPSAWERGGSRSAPLPLPNQHAPLRVTPRALDGGLDVDGGEAMPRRLAAVVLNYRTPLETLLAVRSLLASRRAVDEIVVVDNGSDDGSCERLERGVEHAPGRIRLLRNASNLGFAAGVNVGIRACLEAGAERVLLLNSDALLAADAIEKLEAILDHEPVSDPGRLIHSPTIGIVAPTLLDATRPETIASRGLSFSPGSGRMRMLQAGTEYHPHGIRELVDGVTGCAMLISREVFERVGLFEEEYFFSFEDLDFCLRARDAGYRSACVLAAVAYHHGSRSIGPRSPLRLYYASRNHLLLARRAAPRGAAVAAVRALWIVCLNLASALRGTAAPRVAGVRQVMRGVGHHLLGRYGPAMPGAVPGRRSRREVSAASAPGSRAAPAPGQHVPSEPTARAGRRA